MAPVPHILPVILAGGGGSRLWPLSRDHHPKQFLALRADSTASLLQDTLERVRGGSEFTSAAPTIVCNEHHRFLVAEHLRQLGLAEATVMLEPVARNTAPALSAAACLACANGGDAVLVVMPADHLIADAVAFRAALAVALRRAEHGEVVTFGVVPTHAETGYGYLETGAALGCSSPPCTRLARFREKPDAQAAAEYCASGRHLWNAGIFVVRASVWLRHARTLCPAIASAATAAVAAGQADADFFRLAADAFAASPSDSIDYAVMEPLCEQGAGAAVVALDAGWSDVGSWASLWRVSPHDADGNVLTGDVCAIDSRDTLVYAQHRLVATLGCAELVIAESADAVLVADRSRAEDVRTVVDWLAAQDRPERLTHRRVYRPWGSYETTDIGARFKVKRITVAPGAALSLQLHRHRAEHWVVVSGTARVTRGEERFLLGENESAYIPRGARHRLENPGTLPLELIEVQSGSYLGEDDIVRFEDDYHRV